MSKTIETTLTWYDPNERPPENNPEIDIIFLIESEMEDNKIVHKFNSGVFNFNLFHEGIFSTYEIYEVKYWAYLPELPEFEE